MKRKITAIILVVALVLALAIPMTVAPVAAATTTVDGTNWQKTTNYDVATTIGLSDYACTDGYWGWTTSNIWDGPSAPTEVPAQTITGWVSGDFWAEWDEHGVYTHYWFTCDLDITDASALLEVKLVSKYKSPAKLTINDDLYVYVNGNYAGSGGTAIPAGKTGMPGDFVGAASQNKSVAPETDGWYIDGGLPILTDDFVDGTNTICILVEDFAQWGGVGHIQFQITTNEPPVAVADGYSTNEDTPLVIGAPGVLTNDTDAESDPLTAIKVTDPSYGSVTLSADGSFTYTPDTDYNGSDSFTYKANDGTADSNVATVTITVDPVNDPPVAVDDAYTTDEDTALVVAAPGVLGNDSDVDGDSLTAILDTNVNHGVLALNSDGSFIYTPDQGYFGGLADGESDTDSFTYKANDGTADSNVATVTITVTGNNDPVLRASKSADTTMAIPGETITYTIVVHNGGDCTLGVTVVDAMLGIDDYFRLAKGDTKTYTIPYLVTCSDPEILKNTVTVSAIHSEGRVRLIERSWEVQTMFAHTIGYWKNHDWCMLPEGSMFYPVQRRAPEMLLSFFPGRGAEDNGVNPVEMLRAQLIAAEFNFACYNGAMCYTRYTEADITGTMRQAEALLQRLYNDAGGTGNPDLDSWWDGLSKKTQKNVRQACEPLKDILATFNEIGDGYWE